MYRYSVRFQLQSGSKHEDSVTYYSDIGPCSKREAKERLAQLWAKTMSLYGDHEWNSNLKQAIEKAKRAVDGAYNAGAQEQRNFYSTNFHHKGTTFRVDIAIESGGGHFT